MKLGMGLTLKSLHKVRIVALANNNRSGYSPESRLNAYPSRASEPLIFLNNISMLLMCEVGFVAKNGTFLMARFVPEMAHCAHFAISVSFGTVSLYGDWSAHFAISGSFSTVCLYRD